MENTEEKDQEIENEVILPNEEKASLNPQETKTNVEEPSSEEFGKDETQTELPQDTNIQEKQGQASEDGKRVKAKKIKLPLKKVFYALLVLIIIGLGTIVLLFGSQIAKRFSLGTNQYGFDYNFNRVKNHDWDSLLTEKKIAQALNVSAQKINTQKNPDYSWILEAPEELVNQVICGSIMEEKILYEKSENENNLFNVSIMLCKDTKKGQELFQTRKDNLQLLAVQDVSIKIKEVGEEKNLGEGSYNYILEKTAPTAAEDQQPTTELYSGLVFYRGPFIIRIEETQQGGDYTVIAQKEMRSDLAKHIDSEIKSSLSLF